LESSSWFPCSLGVKEFNVFTNSLINTTIQDGSKRERSSVLFIYLSFSYFSISTLFQYFYFFFYFDLVKEKQYNVTCDFYNDHSNITRYNIYYKLLVTTTLHSPINPF